MAIKHHYAVDKKVLPELKPALVNMYPDECVRVRSQITDYKPDVSKPVTQYRGVPVVSDEDIAGVIEEVDSMKECTVCHEPYEPTSGNQKKCEACRNIVTPAISKLIERQAKEVAAVAGTNSATQHILQLCKDDKFMEIAAAASRLVNLCVEKGGTINIELNIEGIAITIKKA